jgi:hypothetical protein
MPSNLARLSLLLLAAAGTCFLTFKVMGARVDSHGVLHEPFALVPLGYLLMAGAAGVGAADRLRRTAGE